MSLTTMITIRKEVLSWGTTNLWRKLLTSILGERNHFLIIKYGIVAFNGAADNAYELVTLGTKKLHYYPIERKVAREVIEKHNLPLLHKVDSRNMIWGDENFKIQFKERRIEL